MSTKDINGRIPVQLYNELIEFREEKGYSNFGQVLADLWKHYQKTQHVASPAKQSAKATKNQSLGSSEAVFLAKVLKKAVPMLEEFRQDMFEEGKLEDSHILMHLLNRHFKLKQLKAVLVNLPQRVKQMVIQQSQEDIETGVVKNQGEGSPGICTRPSITKSPLQRKNPSGAKPSAL